ncbi:stage II sporulation protein M [Cellvibrio sp. ARAG 10.3]|uniref:stage II sporulation protein M n=1 Tax=Cellvibrio sp. ARAG 10.3 TaxID=3451358 RepID=UPI003F466762
MKQGQFEALYQPVWQALETLIEQLEARKGVLTAQQLTEFAPLYRKVCHFHALAKERRYSSYLVDKLGDLVVRGHQQLYRRKQPLAQQFLRFIVTDFPRLVRQEQGYFWTATALLYLPGLLLFLAVLWQPDLVYTIMAPEQVDNFEEMYNPANRTLGSARESATNWQMFGFYISNNIGVSFRTFASGLLYGIGSIFFLVFNGLLFGAVAGHLTNAEYTETFFTFVVGHGSFELTAIVISGAAGLKLGYHLLNPGNRTRLEALKQAGRIAIRLVYGVIIMLVIAAFIEAFWSSNNILVPWQKYLVGAALWVVVIAYLCLSGRQGKADLP